ncbi:hypothetical protein Pmani_004598 [Petrolisthes manimaculis]|uniref:Uncharacterized protein n=1 Tax=Petrolisthes manimaculis TaxID=1843537 RepID=A0AAE1QEE6_9EUCA|nr:hypothetical protein Pmani_004598 [Petrolisthes manimaculis]
MYVSQDLVIMAEGNAASSSPPNHNNNNDDDEDEETRFRFVAHGVLTELSPLQKWLNKYQPSTTYSRVSGSGWIWVFRTHTKLRPKPQFLMPQNHSPRTQELLKEMTGGVESYYTDVVHTEGVFQRTVYVQEDVIHVQEDPLPPPPRFTDDNSNKGNWKKEEGGFENTTTNTTTTTTNTTYPSSDTQQVQETEDDDEDEMDLEALLEAWQRFQSSEQRVNKQVICEMAKRYHVISGKWMIFVDRGTKSDLIWSLIAQGVVTGKSLSRTAKISTIDPSQESRTKATHVVCIYNDNFLDEAQVFESERTIRNLGITCQLMYKPDVYTYLNVYSRNKWNISPVLYRSSYDIGKGKSIIKKV